MITEHEKNELEAIGLLLQEIAVVVLVGQAANVASEDKIFGADRYLERCVLFVYF